MSKKAEVVSLQPEEHGATLKSYVTGFVLSLVFTLVPYFLVVNHLLTGNVLLAAILGIAMAQLIVQLVFFLHLAQEQKPRWNLIFFINFLLVILFIVIGSIWIMHNLNYMTPTQVINETFKQEGMRR